MRGTSRIGKLVAGADLICGAAAVGSGAAEAGSEQLLGVDVDVLVSGPDAPTVILGLTVEIYDDVGGEPGPLLEGLQCIAVQGSSEPFSADSATTCELELGDYVAGLDGVPDGWSVGGFCDDSEPPVDLTQATVDSATFLFYGDLSATCSLFVSASALMIDIVVVGGDAASSGFTIEVLDGDTVVAGGNDVADATCEADFDTQKCGEIIVPTGLGFQIAEPTVADYELISVECAEFVSAARPPQEPVTVTPIGDDGFRTVGGDTYCVVTNTHVPPPTTTPSTTTVAPATTIAATTTTEFDSGGITLPETGPSESTNTTLAVVAAFLVGIGGLMVLVRRRPS